MRLEVSKRTDIALRALAHLYSNDGASGAALAEAAGTTANYLPQVLKPMVTAGFVRSTPGPGGGYRICGDLEEISVLDVIEAIEGGLELTNCVLRGAPCPALEPCALHDSWRRARSALLAELGSTSVASTIEAGHTKGD